MQLDRITAPSAKLFFGIIQDPITKLYTGLQPEQTTIKQPHAKILLICAPKGVAELSHFRQIDLIMLSRLYTRILELSQHPKALWVLATVAFFESSFFPIPPDLLILPMILATPYRAWLIAAVAMVASVLGGLLGYAIGALMFDQLGEPILQTLGKSDAMLAFNQHFNNLGFWAILTAGLTPFPYKVITIMAGWTAMPLGKFIVTSFLARGLRFFVVAALLWKFGAPIRDFIERRLGFVTVAFVLILVGGVLFIKGL